MKRWYFVLAFLLATLAHAGPAVAQPAKIGVSVTHTGEDSVGRRFAFAVRELVRGSHGYTLEDRRNSLLRISIITLDPEDRNTGSWAVATVVYTMQNLIPYEPKNPQTWYPIYLTSQVLTIGGSRVEEQAKNVLATLDDQVQEYRSAAK